MKPDELKGKLKEYHIQLGVPILNYTSPISGSQFPGEFNVSGFHKEVQELSKDDKSFWGVDTCLRLKDKIGEHHSFLFEMGIFAKSIDLQKDFREPFKDDRFAGFQKEIITQFMQLMEYLGIKTKKLEATYLGKVTFGCSKYRDKTLIRKYTFPEDQNSKIMLNKFGVKCYSVSSLANIDIHPVEDSLAGLRIEIAYNGIEIATIVFDCFKIKEGKLIPINYVGGYAVGIERLMCALNEENNFLSHIPKYTKAFSILKNELSVIESSLLRDDVLVVLFGAEVLSKLQETENLSKSQKDLFRQFKKRFEDSCGNLGVRKSAINKLVDFYDDENSHNRS